MTVIFTAGRKYGCTLIISILFYFIKEKDVHGDTLKEFDDSPVKHDLKFEKHCFNTLAEHRIHGFVYTAL